MCPKEGELAPIGWIDSVPESQKLLRDWGWRTDRDPRPEQGDRCPIKVHEQKETAEPEWWGCFFLLLLSEAGSLCNPGWSGMPHLPASASKYWGYSMDYLSFWLAWFWGWGLLSI